MDPKSVKATGPWLFVKVLKPKDPFSFEAMKSEIYCEDGESWQRVGYSRGYVYSVGVGKYTKKNKLVPIDVEAGDVVLFRGYLQGALQPMSLEDDSYCFIHMDSIDGVMTELEGDLYELPEVTV